MNPVLELDDVSLRRQGRSVLGGLRVCLQAGDCLAVLGPNGAGKSSLVRAIAGEWPVQGALRLWGRERAAWPRTELARRVAVMTQQQRLVFDFSVREVLALGRVPHAGEGAAAERQVVDEVIDALDLQALADRPFPQLSGGEQQRVQFGRALVQVWRCPEDALLILDEPCSALDLAQQRSVFAQVRRLRERGIAVLTVLHDLRMAGRHASHALLLRAGRSDGCLPIDQALQPARVAATFGIDGDEAAAALGGVASPRLAA